MYGICERCGKLIELERSNVGVGWVWHGYCCGWNQTPPPMPFEEAKNYSVQQSLSGSEQSSSPKSDKSDF